MVVVHGAEVERVGGVVGVAAGQSRHVGPCQQSQRARVSRTADLPAGRAEGPRGALHMPRPAARARLHRLVVRQAGRLAASAARPVLCTARATTVGIVHRNKSVFIFPRQLST